MTLQGKRILFIGPKFHGYEIMIKEELEKKGALVDFFSERSYHLDFNIVNNFFGFYLANYQAKHYDKILALTIDKRYDYLFVIRGYMLPISFLNRFKQYNPESKTIMYQWDAQRTNSFSHLIDSFDVVKTFDFKDSEDLNIKYIPLFYTQDIHKYLDKNKVCEYDFFFMGFFFPERYEAILKFKDFCVRNGYSLKPFLYMPFTTRIRYFFKGDRLDRSIVSFKHMDRSEYLKILSRSRIMVDVSNSRQTGLAMRVIESLACNTKVATNNVFFEKDKVIRDSGMVSLFHLNDIFIDRGFLESDFKHNGKLVLSLEQWVEQIFS